MITSITRDNFDKFKSGAVYEKHAVAVVICYFFGCFGFFLEELI